MSRKTQIGWIAVGVLLCLFSIGLTLKLRDGNKVAAGEDDKEAKAQLPDPTSPPPPVMIPTRTFWSDSIVATALATACDVAPSMALRAWGRLIVTTATWPSISNSTDMKLSLDRQSYDANS